MALRHVFLFFMIAVLSACGGGGGGGGGSSTPLSSSASSQSNLPVSPVSSNSSSEAVVAVSSSLWSSSRAFSSSSWASDSVGSSSSRRQSSSQGLISSSSISSVGGVSKSSSDDTLTLSSSSSSEAFSSSNAEESSSSSTRSSSAPAPGVPALAAAGGNGRITLSWSQVANAESYDLYFSTEPGITPDTWATLKGGDVRLNVISPYQLTRLNNGTTYYLVLTAKSQGSESPASREVSVMPVLPPVLPTGRLNDTGIQWCANGNTNGLPCPVADYPGQDGESGSDALARASTLVKVGGGAAGFDFTKLDKHGNTLPVGASEWTCARDNRTGLIWEVKTDDGGLRDRSHSYAWYNPDHSANGGYAGTRNPPFSSCGGIECNTHAFAQAVNGMGLCGANDWRIPERHELLGIVHYGAAVPAIDKNYFPRTMPSDHWEIAEYWSSTSTVNSYNAWTVDFVRGYVSSGGSKVCCYTASVRLVRNGK